jgi:outer membrane protein TolC
MAHRIAEGLILFLLTCIISPVYAQTTNAEEKKVIPLTLSDAIFLGVRNNRNIRSAYIQRISQKFDLKVAESKFNPIGSITSTAEIGRFQGLNAFSVTTSPAISLQTTTGSQFAFSWNGTATPFPKNNSGESSNLNLQFIQPLLRGSGTDVNLASVRIARLAETNNRLALKSTVMSTVTQIINAYRAFTSSDEQLQISRQSLIRSKDVVNTSHTLIDSGRMAEQDIVQAEADEANQEVSVFSSESTLDAARLALLALLALDARTKISAVEKPTAEATELNVDRLLGVAYTNRPDYLGQLIAIEQAKLGVLVAKNNQLWDLSLVGSATWGQSQANSPGVSTITGSTRSAYGGFQLTIPINDPSFEQNKIHATTQAQVAQIQTEELKQQIETQVRNSVTSVETAWKQVITSQRAAQLSWHAVEIEREKLQIGRSSNFQVLALETQLRATEVQRINSVINYLNFLTSLDQTLGTTLDTWHIEISDR